jgi:hypothetical protein
VVELQEAAALVVMAVVMAVVMWAETMARIEMEVSQITCHAFARLCRSSCMVKRRGWRKRLPLVCSRWGIGWFWLML